MFTFQARAIRSNKQMNPRPLTLVELVKG